MFKVKSRLVLFMIILVIVMAGCSSGNDDSNGKGGKITIFNSKVEISEQLEALAEEYETETGVEVEIWGSTGDDYSQQILAKLASDQGPSIFSVKAKDLKMINSYLADLSNEEYVQYVAPNMELKYEDKVVGIPYGVEGFGLIYNTNLIDSKNVSDYNSFVETLKSLNEKGISGPILSQEAYFLIGHILNTPFALQEDPIAFIEKLNKHEVKLAEVKEFQEFAKYMEAIRENTKNPLEVTYDTQIGDFATQKSAMIHQGNWAYGMFEDYGDLDFEFDMLPFPLAGNDKIAVGVGNYWAVNGNASQEETKAANDFLNWMFTSDIGKKYIVEEFGFLPAMTNIEVTDGQVDSLSKIVLEASNSGNTIPWALNYFPAGMIDKNLTPVAQEFFLSKDMTGQQLLEKLDAVWTE